MSPNVEELLRDGIGRLAANAEVPASLLARAKQHNRRRRQAITAAVAAGTAAVTAAAVIAATTGTSSTNTGALHGQTITYVATRAEQALAHLDQDHAIETDTDILTNASFGWTVLNLAANGTNGSDPPGHGALSDVRASRLVNWIYGIELQQGYSAAGKLVFSGAIRQTGTQHGEPVWEADGAAYPARTQWHSRLTVTGQGPEPSLTCGNSGIGYPDWRQSIAKALSCHLFTLAGNQEVDGIDTIKLVGKPVVGNRTTLWVDPTSYLPVRIMTTDQQPSRPPAVQTDDFRWLPPTTGNLAALHAAEQRGAIPSGFRSLPKTDLPVSGPVLPGPGAG